METQIKKKEKNLKVIIIVIVICILFSIYIINGIKEHTIIPDHIHSIDDKSPEERTAYDNITILERTIQNDPGNIQAMLELSALYIKTDDEKSAKETLKKIIEIDPYNKEAGDRLKQLD